MEIGKFQMFLSFQRTVSILENKVLKINENLKKNTSIPDQ